MDYSGIITMEAGKRGAKPCIRGLRMTVGDVLEYLASGMTHAEILEDFPYLTEEDIRACLAFAADRERFEDCPGRNQPLINESDAGSAAVCSFFYSRRDRV